MTPLVRLPRGAIRARRRPSAIVALWCWEAALGLLLGTSVASVVSGAYGGHPDGDAPLFAPGGLELLDLLRHAVAARGPILSLTLVVMLLARFAGIIPSAYAFVELAFSRSGGGRPRARDALARAIEVAPASLAVSLMTLPVQGVLMGIGVAVAAAASPSTSAHLGPRGADVFGVSVVGLAALAASVVGVVGDLGRAAVVWGNLLALDAARAGVATFGRHPVRLAWAYAWRALASCVPIAVAAALATRIGGRGGVALLVLTGFHQLVILTRVAIRTSWMAEALRALDVPPR